MRRAALVVTVLAVVVSSCGDNGPPAATPLQADAIGSLIDADLSGDEQRCILEELIATEIDPQAIIEGAVTGKQDAELLAIAVTCVVDLASVPAFVQTVIDASAESGTPFTETEAVCVIRRMADADPVTAAADCLNIPTGAVGTTNGAVNDYGDDAVLDLLWDACEGGNSQACDDLYLSAPLETEYLEFARTCAGQLPDSVGLRCFVDLG
jgi:hypothetical protein